jgi:gamma-glutamyl phosphate reductase
VSKTHQFACSIYVDFCQDEAKASALVMKSRIRQGAACNSATIPLHNSLRRQNARRGACAGAL